MQYDVIIIGGGAAGLTAALSASAQGAETLILEAAPRIGRKILASGNGRCNLANRGAPRYAGNPMLARRVLEICPVERLLAAFQGLGLPVCEEAGGRVYPACGQAAAVLDVLRLALARRHVSIRTETPVLEIARRGEGFRLHTGSGDFEAPAVVAAFGGMAGNGLGHDGRAYGLLTRLGHTLRPPMPALVPLIGEKKDVKGLSGLRLPAILTLCTQEESGREIPVEAAQGEALFTDYGVSGVCAMQLARKAGELLQKRKKLVLYLDFSPMLGLVPRVYDRVPALPPRRNLEKVRACLEERTHILPQGDLLCGLVPRLLAQRLAGETVADMAALLCAYPVRILGVKGFEQAQVTAGGIPGGEFDPDTLESRIVPGLFAAGELLDVDGDCGGYNLQFAFASGLITGKSASLIAKNHEMGGRL